MVAKFNELNFGFASAELEGASNPELLLDGYFNLHNIIKEAHLGSKFLFLGYKGSGKSAISEHLRLIANRDENLFVRSISLADISYSQMKRIVWGDIEQESKFPIAWSWLILTTLYESFSEDDNISCDFPLDYTRALDVLKETGLLPMPTWRQVVLATSKRSFSISFPTNMQSELEKNIVDGGMQIPFFVDNLRSIALALKSTKKHLIVIDGLDDILTSRKAQFDALAALILVAGKLNLDFQRYKSPAKIIILCRTDLFEKLPGANKNKIRQDSAIQIDWYQDPRNPRESHLVELLNLRAGLANQSSIDIFRQYFPKSVEDRHIVTFLLELTRHTPRDLIQLMKHIQEFAGPYRITKDDILSGVRSYSVNYFLPEIKDELVGFVNEEDIASTLDIIGTLRKRDFFYSELVGSMEKQPRYSNLDLETVIKALFESSAIGNIHKRGGRTYYTFKFRNRNSTLDIDDRLILHRGMWKALNLP